MLEPKLKRLLSFYGDDIVQKLQRELRINDNVATGQAVNTLDYDVKFEGGRVVLDILGKYYVKLLDEGRKPGGRSPSARSIEKWIEAKSTFTLRDRKGRFIPKTKSNIKQAAFNISRSIKANGTKGNGMINFVMKPMESKVLADVVTLFVEEELNQIIRNKTN